LFAPIAPTVRVHAVGERVADDPALHPPVTVGLETVAWQHVGFGDSAIAATSYASKRLHRDRLVPVPGGAVNAALSQVIDAAPYRGRLVRLSGKLRTARHGQGQLWLRVDRAKGPGFIDDMVDQPVTSESWREVEIVAPVDDDATQIVLGTVMHGTGTVWYDDLALAARTADGTWAPIALGDGGFEDPDPIGAWHAGVSRPNRPASLEGWRVTLDHDRPATGASALRVEQATQRQTAELFAESPAAGDSVEIDLGAGLQARVPIALYSRDGHTLGDSVERARSSQATPVVNHAGYDPIAGIADVIVVWNVLGQFWPYWDLFTIDWSAELDRALAGALADRSIDQHVTTLRRLLAAAPDGHSRVRCSGEAARAYPPFVVESVGDAVVVTASADPQIARGDEIVAIDGQPIAPVVAAHEAVVSGSPQWRRAVAMTWLGLGPLEAKLALRLRRADRTFDVTVARIDRDDLAEPDGHPPIDRLGDGVYYVDLSRVSSDDVTAVIGKLASAPGVVFDVRGAPSTGEEVLAHLLTRYDDAQWLAVPHRIRPDSPTRPAAWVREGWELSPLAPHIAGRVAFVGGPFSKSYAESILGLAAYYHLGEIVGAPTAGANGNIAEIAAPTGCRAVFTGRKVTRPDGSQFHQLGVLPTISARRTIAGITAGRDEVLERALAYVRTGK
jgi:C-terminal processing protease CtpA/Prc